MNTFSVTRLRRQRIKPPQANRLQAARHVLSIGAVLYFALLSVELRAQTNYTVDWFTVDGGGGTSTGGVYALSASIGQPDAGTLTGGGNYELLGGFWSIVAAVQTSGAPFLSLALTPTNTVVVFWPSPSTGYVLQQTVALEPSNWVNLTEVPNDNGSIKSVVVASPMGNRFYRLSNSVPALRVRSGASAQNSPPSAAAR